MASRAEVVQLFLDEYEDARYLEIGVNRGETFNAVSARSKVAVDPKFLFDPSCVAAEQSNVTFHEITSDAYFASLPRAALFDVVFIDGLHTYEQTLRDLLNALEHLSPKGVVVVDDVIPDSYAASLADLNLVGRLRHGTGSGDLSWMGDVYKLVFFVQTFLQQFSYATVEENHGQLVLWRSVRPAAEVGKFSAEDVARLQYADVIDRPDVFNYRPLAAILNAVRVAQGAEGDTNADAPLLFASAGEKCARDCAWATDLVGKDGRRLVSGGSSYRLVEFRCPNADLLNLHARQTLDGLRQLNCVSVPPIEAFAFNGAVALPYGVIRVGDHIVTETYDPLPTEVYRDPVKQFDLATRDKVAVSCDVSASGGPVLFLEQPGLFNYGHWLVEMLPKVAVFLDDILRGSVQLTLPATYKHSQLIRGTLSSIGVDARRVVWTDIEGQHSRTVVRFDRAVYVSPISKHSAPGCYVSSWSVETLNRLTARLPPGSDEKIFVSRRDASARFLLNEDELFGILQPLGYVRICAGEMSFEEQVSTFRGATHVVGVFGASMSNIVFCRAGARVMLICPSNFVDHFYWDLASLRRLDYWHFNGSPAPGQEDSIYCDFTAEVRNFRDVVRDFETSVAAAS